MLIETISSESEAIDSFEFLPDRFTHRASIYPLTLIVSFRFSVLHSACKFVISVHFFHSRSPSPFLLLICLISDDEFDDFDHRCGWITLVDSTSLSSMDFGRCPVSSRVVFLPNSLNIFRSKISTCSPANFRFFSNTRHTVSASCSDSIMRFQFFLNDVDHFQALQIIEPLLWCRARHVELMNSSVTSERMSCTL